MGGMAGPISAEEAASFLATHHGSAVTDVEPLSGGLWSAAFGYRLEGHRMELFGTPVKAKK